MAINFTLISVVFGKWKSTYGLSQLYAGHFFLCIDGQLFGFYFFEM